MQVNAPYASGAGYSPSTGKSDQQIADTDKAFSALLNGTSDPAEMLSEITSGGINGYWKWKIKQLQEKVASEVMQEMNATPESIAAMPDQQRAALEDKIMKEVERRVKEMVATEMERNRQMPLNVSAANPTDLGIDLMV